MIEELNFIKGGVSKSTLIPELTHIKLKDCNVQSSNGTITLSSAIDCDLNCSPKAIPFISAIQKCTDSISLGLTNAKKLSIKSANFKAFIPCLDNNKRPQLEPKGEIYEINGKNFMETVKTLKPFISMDASRPWATGVLMKEKLAFATNNVIVIEHSTKNYFKTECNIPGIAIKELLRINEMPEKIQISENTVTLHYAGDKWLMTSLLPVEWPDISSILDKKNNATPINETLFENLEKLKPFVDDFERVFIENQRLSTSTKENEGASIDVPGFDHTGIYQLSKLQLLQDVATKIDFTLYPKPCLFYGNNIRGAIIGIKK